MNPVSTLLEFPLSLRMSNATRKVQIKNLTEEMIIDVDKRMIIDPTKKGKKPGPILRVVPSPSLADP